MTAFHQPTIRNRACFGAGGRLGGALTMAVLLAATLWGQPASAAQPKSGSKAPASAAAAPAGKDPCRAGREYHASGDVLKAIASLEKCVDKESRNREAWSALGNARMEAGRFPGAADAFAKAQAIRPGDATFLVSYLDALEGSGRTEERISVLRALVESKRDDGRHAERLLALVDSLGPGKHDDDRLFVLEKLGQSPNSVLLHQEKLAAAYQARGLREKAQAEFRGLLSRRPENGEYWAGLGASVAKDDREAALECYRKAIFYSNQAGLRSAYEKEIAQLKGAQAKLAAAPAASPSASPATVPPAAKAPALAKTPPGPAKPVEASANPAKAPDRKEVASAAPAKPFDIKAFQDSIYKVELEKRMSAIKKPESESSRKSPDISLPSVTDAEKAEKARMEARFREDQERKAKADREEKDRLAEAAQEKSAREEKEKQDRLAREEKEKQDKLNREQKEQQEKLAREQKEQQEKLTREAAMKAEEDRKLKEKLAKDSEKKAKEVKAAQEKLAKEEKAKQDKLAKEQKEQQEKVAKEQKDLLDRQAKEEKDGQEKLAKETARKAEEDRKLKEKAAQEAVKKAKDERDRIVRDSLAQVEKERLAKVEAEKKAKEEKEKQEKLARIEKERLDKLAQEAAKQAKEERDRIVRDSLAQAEKDRLAKLEAEKKVKEDKEKQEKLARADAERKAREEKEKQEKIARAEKERLDKLAQEAAKKAKEERERFVRDSLAQVEKERLARLEAEKKAKEEKERLEKLARAEKERLEKLAQEAARKAKEERERFVRDSLAQVEKERLARVEAERKAKEERERLAREEAKRKAEEEKARKLKEEQEKRERLAREKQERHDRAIATYKEGKLDSSELLFKTVLSETPTPDAYYYAGRVHLDKGHADKALDLLSKAPKDKGDLDGLMGRAFMKAGKKPEALAALERHHAKAPDVNVLEDICALKRALGDAPGMAACLEMLAEKRPMVAKYQEELAIHYGKLGDKAKSLNHFARLLALEPAHGEANYRLGMDWSSQGVHDRAVPSLEKAVMAFHDRSAAWKALARGQAALGRKDQALTSYKKAASMLPKDADVARGILALAKDPGRESELPGAYQALLKLVPEDRDANMGFAKLRFQAKDYAGAERHFRIGCQDSKDAAAWGQFGRSLLELKKTDEASVALQKALDLGETSVGLRLDLARLHLDKGDADKAEVLVKQISAKLPADPEPYFWLAKIAGKRQQAAVQEEFLRKANQLRPDEPKYAEAVAAMFRDRDEFKQAVSVLAPVEAKLSSQGKALLAECLAATGEGKRALEIYSVLFQKEPGPVLLSRKIDALVRMGKAGEAVDAARGTVFAEKPEVQFSLAKAHLALSESHVLKGDLDLAISLLKDALDADSHRSDYHFHLGMAYYRQDKFKKAMDSYTEAMVYRVDYPDAVYRKGYCLVELNRAGEARNFFTELAQHADPRWKAKGLSGLARVFEAEGKWEAVEHHLVRSNATSPSPDAMSYLSRVYLKLGRFQEAEDWAGKALAIDKSNEEGTLAMAEALAARKKVPEALGLAEAALRIKPLSCDLLVQSARLNLEAGRLDSTLTTTGKAIMVCPEEPLAHFYAGMASRGSNKPEDAKRHFKSFRKLGGDKKMVPE